MSIKLYRSGSYNRTISSSTSSDGSFSWTVPTDLSSATYYQIKITSTSSSSLYNYSDYFEISETPPIDPILSVSDVNVDFDDLEVGQESDWQNAFEVGNIGEGVLDVEVSFPLRNSNFVIHPEDINFSLNTGDTYYVRIRFTPQEIGDLQANVTIDSDFGTEVRIVYGTGIEGEEDPLLYVSGNYIFNDVVVGQNSGWINAFEVGNNGGGVLSVSVSLSYTGSNFEIHDDDFSFSLNAGQTQFVQVMFIPQSIGDLQSNITFTSNGGTNIRIVHGTGLDPQQNNLHNIFQSAGNYYAIPYNLLKAMAHIESGWTQIPFGNGSGGDWGIMQINESHFVTNNSNELTPAMLRDGFNDGYNNSYEGWSEYSGKSDQYIIDLVKTDSMEGAKANIRAGAALLRRFVNSDTVFETEEENTIDMLETWWFPITQYNGGGGDVSLHSSNYPYRIYNTFLDGVNVAGDGQRVPQIPITFPPHFYFRKANPNELSEISSSDYDLIPVTPNDNFLRVTPSFNTTTDFGTLHYNNGTVYNTNETEFKLQFPMYNQSAINCTITSVYDYTQGGSKTLHGQSPIYNEDNYIVDYLNDIGEFRHGSHITTYYSGYKKTNGLPFLLENNYYDGTEDFLYYDGHPAYDYRTKTPDHLYGYGTPILATASGIISISVDDWNSFIIDHGNNYKTKYLHCQNVGKQNGIIVYQNGDYIEAGSQIAESGAAGSPNNPHLHLEVLRFGKKIDPYGWNILGNSTEALNSNLWSNNVIEQESNSIPANNQEEQNFPIVGVDIQFTENHSATEISVVEYNVEPSVVGNLPGSVVNLGNTYWSVYSSDGNVGEYEITFDLSEIEGIVNFNTLTILKRDNSTSEWENVITDLGATLVYNEPFITIQGLNAFSDFVPAGGNDNTLPVELSSFTAIQTSANFAKLNWQTQSETGLVGYNVYRNTAETVEGGFKLNSLLINPSNTSSESNYSFIDKEVEFEQDYFYWLESVESDGSFEYFGPTAIRIMNNGDGDEDVPEIVFETKIQSIFPNPFNPSATISFSLKEESVVDISVFNFKGQLMKKLENGIKQKGNHSVIWNGSDSNGKTASSGIYFFKMKAGKNVLTKRAILLK